MKMKINSKEEYIKETKMMNLKYQRIVSNAQIQFSKFIKDQSNKKLELNNLKNPLK